MTLTINLSNKQRDLKINLRKVRRLIKAALLFEEVLCDEISVCFVDEKTLCDMHAEYFDDPSPTDCITFPIDDPSEEGYCCLGEIFISPKAAIDFVQKKDGDPLEEVGLYIIHGILHLLGYDDIQPNDRRKMRAAEKKTPGKHTQ